ncbi:MAG: YbaB/EbfC family nucleoid-associated protein [Candidatus Buchananbacteria bacterium]
MLDKLKQLGQLKSIQDSLKAEKYEVEKNGVKVVINGSLMIKEIVLSPDFSVTNGCEIIKDCINEAITKAQRSMAQKLAGMNLGF